MMPQRKTLDRFQRIARRARTLALVYFVILFVGTHIPATAVGNPNLWDKGFHFGGYALLTICVLAGWELTVGLLQARHFFAVWFAGVLYAAFDEWTQIPVGRTCDMNDWLADVLGIVGGIVIYQLLRPLLFAIVGRSGAMAAEKC
jgi:VanZ family protein